MKKGGRERVKVGVCEGEGSGLREGGREGGMENIRNSCFL